jgi:PAS domain S-box-containing protein
MPSEQILKVVDGTADAAFAIDGFGLISAWNKAAQELFGLSTKEAISQACHTIIQGMDDGGVVCSDHCSVQQAMQKDCPVRNFDVQMQTKNGREWCNVSVLIVTDPRTRSHHAVHIVRPREMRRRLEQLARDFVLSEHEIKPEGAARLILPGSIVGANIELTAREKEILRLVETGASTKEVAKQFNISPATVNNHIKHILTKLDAHSRLEAVHRAQQSGLI